MLGSSRLQTVTSISESPSSEKVSCVPQLPQNCRLAWSLDRKIFGMPRRMLKSAAATVNHATIGDPDTRWQVVQ